VADLLAGDADATGDGDQRPRGEDFFRDLSLSGGAKLVRRELSHRWPESPEQLMAIVRYALLPPGKLLRPILVLASTELVGGSPDTVLPAALGMEYMHTATLIHDDVIDNDGIRRSRPSVPAAFGVPAAIVAGDHLIFAAVEAITQCRGLLPADRIVTAVGVLASAGTDMCRGQLMEGQMTGDPGAGVAVYLEMIRLKTGALFQAVCEIGAVLAGAGPDQVQKMARYGEHLGMAFQIRDDLLAYSVPAELAGKPATSDLANGRPTLAVLLAFEASDQARRRRLTAALNRGSARQVHLEAMLRLLRDTGALARSHELAIEQAELATACLAEFAASPSRNILTEAARWAAQAAQ
jgi:geranylgeranyl diphosphate synthase, type I